MRLTVKISRGSARLARAAAVAVVGAGVLAGGGSTHAASVQAASPLLTAHGGASVQATGARLTSVRHGVIVLGNASQRTAMPAGSLPTINMSMYSLCANDSTYKGLPNTEGPFSAQLAGWSDVSKLDGALSVGYPAPAAVGESPPGGYIMTASPLVDPATDDHVNCTKINIDLDYKGQREFPPASGTFLAFGFVPVTATVHLIQAGPIVAVAYLDLGSIYGTNAPYGAVSTAQVSVQLTNVKVNGVPLDVGNNCHSSGILTSPGNPLNYNGLVLVGGQEPGDPGPSWVFGLGGSLAGTAEVPPFTGCVTPTGEKLDALFTSAVSGPGNAVQIYQAAACIYGGVGNNPDCAGGQQPLLNGPAGVPIMQPSWTVTNAGTYTATSPVTIWPFIRPTRIGCNSTLTVTVGDMIGPPLTHTASSAHWGFTDCHDQLGNPWTVTEQGTLPLDAKDETAGVTTFQGFPFNLNLAEQTSGGCTEQISGTLGPEYAAGTFTISPSIIVSDELVAFDKTGGCLPAIPNTEAYLAGGKPGNPNGGSSAFFTPLQYSFAPSFDISSP